MKPLKPWLTKYLKDFYNKAKNLSIGNYISFDMETTGLNMHRNEIHFFTYDYNGEIGLVEMRPDLVKKPKIPKHIEKALKNPNVTKIIQSSQFDIPFFRTKTGIHLRNIWDTQVIEQVILGGRGNPWHDADLHIALARRKIAKLEKETRDTFIDYFGPITKKQRDYGLKDIKYLKTYADQQIKDLKKDGLEMVAVLENLTCEVTAELRYNGIAFDEQYWIELAEENLREYNKRISKLPKSVTNWNSEKQIKSFFWEEHGIKIETLGDLPNIKNKDLDAFKYAREMYSDTTTYGLGFLFRDKKKEIPLVDPDGRVRPNYNQLVDTGRYSCSKPNLQNQKAQTKHRLAYYAPPGSKLVPGDFTGQELGIIAYGSQDETWLKAMRKGHDLHSVMASIIIPDWKKMAAKGCKFPFKCSCPNHVKERRPVKDLNFGISYGKSLDAFAHDMSMPLPVAGKLYRSWKRAVPKVIRWLESNGNHAVRHGWIRTLPPFNRIRYLYEQPWRKRNQGKNTPIQGSGADMMKLSMCMMLAYIYDNKLESYIKLVLTVHDELLSEVKNKYVSFWKKAKKFFMEEAAMVITKEKLIPVEPEVMERWMPKADKKLVEKWLKEIKKK